jgi:hypothetical protein
MNRPVAKSRMPGAVAGGGLSGRMGHAARSVPLRLVTRIVNKFQGWSTN